MRFWLNDDERRPDPEPAVTDDRTAVLAGLVCWVAGLAALLVFVVPLIEAGRSGWLWTCLVGIGFGLLALVYTHRLGERRG